MLVRERMTHNPITIKDDTSLDDALRIMRENKVRRLPILDASGKLVGIVSEKDLLYASPSPATSLSVWEIHGLLSRIRVSELMTKNVITVCEDCPIEEAARIMVDNKIGGLPVMRGDAVVGIITESDIFRVFTELLGGAHKGIRLSALAPYFKGSMAKISTAIAEAGGLIVSFNIFEGEDASNWGANLKVADISEEDLLKTIKPLVLEVLDIRNT